MKMLKITQLTLISLMIILGLFNSTAVAQPSSGFNKIVWSPDGTKLAGASFAGPIYIWNHAGQLIQTLPGHSDGSVSVAWRPDGNLLASSGSDGYDQLIKVWNTTTGAPVQTLSGFVDAVGHIAFSPTGEQLIGTGFIEVKVWDTTTWDIVAEPSIGTVNAVKWSPDGTMVAFATVAGIHVVDATTYQRLVVFGDYSLQPYGIDWSRDGQYLVSGGRDGTIRLWDMITSTPIGILTQPSIIVGDVSFSPDGTLVAAALDDGTARVWNIASGEQLSIFQQDGKMRSVAWSPDGTLLAYGGRASDEVEILQLPLANAGPDQTLPDVDASGTELVTLDGSASTDPDGTIVAFSWQDDIGMEIATDPTPTVDLPVGVYTLTLTVTDNDGLTASDTVIITINQVTPLQGLEAIIAEVQAIIAANPGTELEDKMEDVLANALTALDELNKMPPDQQAAVGVLESVAGDLDAAVNDGLLDTVQGVDFMDRTAAVARQIAVETLEQVNVPGADAAVIADAQAALDEGDTYRAAGEFKDAISKYKDALAKAESLG